jgi:hypothetical protein
MYRVVAFSLQQWLRERVAQLRCTCVACVVQQSLRIAVSIFCSARVVLVRCTRTAILIVIRVLINTILQEFKVAVNKGIQRTRGKITALYIVCADGQILMATPEGELQTVAYR